MIWILITVLVSLVVVLAQLMLMYQKRAVRLRIAQSPVRKQIDSRRNHLTELGEEVRSLARSRLQQLRTDLGDYQRRSGRAANLTAELDIEAQQWVAAREAESEAEFDANGVEEVEEQDGADEGDEEDAIVGGRHDHHHRVDTGRVNPAELVRAIRHDLEETYEYIEGLRVDANIVTQTVERLGPTNKNGEG